MKSSPTQPSLNDPDNMKRNQVGIFGCWKYKEPMFCHSYYNYGALRLEPYQSLVAATSDFVLPLLWASFQLFLFLSAINIWDQWLSRSLKGEILLNMLAVLIFQRLTKCEIELPAKLSGKFANHALEAIGCLRVINFDHAEIQKSHEISFQQRSKSQYCKGQISLVSISRLICLDDDTAGSHSHVTKPRLLGTGP